MWTFFRQLKIMLRKNWILAKRNRQSTLVQLIVPFIFVLVLYILKLALDANARQGALIKVSHHDSPHELEPLNHCTALKYDFCFTFAYTPDNDPVVNSIVQKILVNTGLENATVKAFPDQDTMNAFFLEFENSTQGAYAFMMNYLPGTQPSWANLVGLRYTIQYNQTDTHFQNNLLLPAFMVAMPMQIAVETAILELVDSTGANVGLDLDVQWINFPHPELQPIDVIAQQGPAFFFGALMFNFVIQMGTLVSEKELHLRQSLKTMGLMDSVYWTSYLITNFIFNFISIWVLIISGCIFQFSFFLKNDFGTYFFLFLLFGFAMAPLAFFLSVFMSKSASATVLGFAIFLIGAILQGFTDIVYVSSTNYFYIFLFSLMPFGLLAKGTKDISSLSDSADKPGFKWSYRSNFPDFFPLTTTYGWLVLDFFIYLVLALYLDQVVPDENGMRQKPWFFLLPSYWFPKESTVSGTTGTSSGDATTNHSPAQEVELLASSHDEEKESDRDALTPLNRTLSDAENVKHELENVVKGQDTDVMDETRKAELVDPEYPVRLVDLGKNFKGYKLGCVRDLPRDFLAVRGISLRLARNQLFCLLGHNGAGKTTTISIMTGLIFPTQGDAVVFDHSIKTDLPSIRAMMGVCPQHDILWEQLTAQEHLEMFSGLRNIPEDQIAKEVTDRLHDVDLSVSGQNLAGQFSGGMRRRLSVAIALIGDPKIVYLDEPTTGMDPVSRRQVWDLIEKVKRQRVTVLTTHSMEEAGVLADRIGIMKRGRLICLGTPLHLKNKFGTGYRITAVVSEPQRKQGVKAHFQQQLPGSEVMIEEEDNIRFNVPRTLGKQLPGFFEHLEDNQEALGVQDLQISLTTLEEVFLSVGAIGDEHDERMGADGQTAEKEKAQSCYHKWSQYSTCKKIGIIACSIITFIILFAIIAGAARRGGGGGSDDTVSFQTLSYTGATATTALKGVWTEVQTADYSPLSVCSRGHPYSFFFRAPPAAVTTPYDLVIEFEGGVTCYDAISCDNSLNVEKYNATVDQSRGSIQVGNYSGIWLTSETTNPLKDFAHLYIPMCTADAHMGNSSHQYDAGFWIQHRGGLNALAALSWIKREFPSTLNRILITGWGSGAEAAVMWTSNIQSLYPTNALTLFVDSSADFNLDDATRGSIPAQQIANFSSVVGNAIQQWTSTMLLNWGVMTPYGSTSPAFPTNPPSLVNTLHTLALSSLSPNLGDFEATANFTNTNVLKAVAAAFPAIKVGRYASLYDARQVQYTFAKFASYQRLIEPYTYGNEALTQFTNYIINPYSQLGFASIYCQSVREEGNVLAATNFRQFLLVNNSVSGVLNTAALYAITGADDADSHAVTLTSWITALLSNTLPGSVGSVGGC